ncbi:hypothetical protein [Sporomusa malonica]|uniref:Uncharacterized protein n=1 Tax=Sporomusa malonica TaxID=112901 RepID=A0A1W2DF72_9FIRM|nr:hypothetical protein [Sporomusa malonica]SMC96105.1 hypothetical protein SAMN04488500_11584 [Sporomusa malonica]
MHITFYEYIYYGIVITSLALYLPLYVKRRHEIIANRRNSTRWGIIVSFVSIGIISVAVNLVNWLPAFITTVISCAVAYYVVFIKYRE